MQTVNSSPTRITSVPAKSRLFTRMGMWYFKTIEGKVVGPFRYRIEAESLLSRFIYDQHETALPPIIGGKHLVG